MRYKTIADLPYVWQLNLPEAAQHVFKDAFNRAWAERSDDREARHRAIEAVRRSFRKDGGRWVAASSPSQAAGANG
jgi:cation transport regulator